MRKPRSISLIPLRNMGCGIGWLRSAIWAGLCWVRAARAIRWSLRLWGRRLSTGQGRGAMASVFGRLGAAQAARAVGSAGDLGDAFSDLLAPDRAARLAQAAWTLASDGVEVTDRVVDFARRVLDGDKLMREPGFWRNPPREAGTLGAGVGPLGWIYAAATARRLRGVGYKAAVPVICIGNINAGGTGKTPTAMALVERLIARGRRVAVVSRGHGGVFGRAGAGGCLAASGGSGGRRAAVAGGVLRGLGRQGSRGGGAGGRGCGR